jgi:hypothetical protein
LQNDSALAYVVTTHRPGETLTLTIVRGNQQRRVPLTLGVQPSP